MGRQPRFHGHFDAGERDLIIEQDLNIPGRIPEIFGDGFGIPLRMPCGRQPLLAPYAYDDGDVVRAGLGGKGRNPIHVARGNQGFGLNFFSKRVTDARP
jgi:hypothetical protein